MRIAREKGQSSATAADGGLALFALGKHGGRELNYSSDIDIVAFFDPAKARLKEPGEETKFFSRIVQKLAALMQDRTEFGYVFRTDLRLRPDPGATPVALPTEAALAYYESRGQNWERAAWIKARPCAGDKAVGEAFLKDLAPYIWRKHLDFATIADIQAMKRQINISKNVGDVRVEGHNVKLGLGGIREIEFFTQTQQLIAGGRDVSLRVRPTAEALAALAAANWISAETAADLTRAYWYLRAVENRLQMRRDEQTHVMPEEPDEIAVIARMLGEPDVRAFEETYRATLHLVVGYYADLFAEKETLGSGTGNLVFTGSDDDPGTLETLSGMGFREPSKAIAMVRKWHYGSYAATRAAAARAHLTELLPALLKTVAEAGNPDEALTRFDNFLSRLPSGVQLFALLRNHDNLRGLLVSLMASAPRMAEAVIHRAHVMDGLIDPAFADEVRRREMLLGKIEAFFAEAIDYQDVIDRARIIGQEQMFLIAAGLLAGTIDARRAGEQFTTLAEALLGRLFAAARREFEKRHGSIPGAQVALLAFGKMASREMTARSDLDFIMLYDLDGRRRVGRREAAAGEPVLRPADAAADRGDQRPDLGGRAVRGRHAAPPLRQRRAAGDRAQGVRAVSPRERLDLGAPGAEPRPGDLCGCRARSKGGGGGGRNPVAAARCGKDHRGCDRDAGADGQGAAAAASVRSEAGDRRAGRSRVHRPIGATGGAGHGGPATGTDGGGAASAGRDGTGPGGGAAGRNPRRVFDGAAGDECRAGRSVQGGGLDRGVPRTAGAADEHAEFRAAGGGSARDAGGGERGGGCVV